MEPWEYRVESFRNPDIREMGDDLNRIGSAGWELVTLTTTVKTWGNVGGNELVAVFKRPGLGAFTERPEDREGYVPY